MKVLLTGATGFLGKYVIDELKNNSYQVVAFGRNEKIGKALIDENVEFFKGDIDNLDDLNINIINEAPLLEDLFIDEEWGGANEARSLDDSTLGILGHVACFDEDGNRHYYPMTFKLNINTLEVKNQKIIAIRKNFKPGEAKRADLEDVVFSGGLVLNGDKAVLYAGISDAEAQLIEIDNPFK